LSYVDQWQTLAARIRSVTTAGQLYAQFQVSHSQDTYGTINFLGDQCKGILEEIKRFGQLYSNTLPSEAMSALNRFLDGDPANVIRGTASLRDGRAALVFLAGLESEISYLLSDQQEFVRARSERAFLHLQRLLVVDEDVRKKWQTAYDRGERHCEQLGAVHLLWHGIAAFKVDSSGARTDLVFRDVDDATTGQRAVDGLVLTEWKVADDLNQAKTRFDEARHQAALYTQGPLFGSELRAYRYLVVVSPRDLEDIPDDKNEGGVIYRHINIAIDPRSPSVAAPRKRRASKN
jgi:hypothetical protein